MKIIPNFDVHDRKTICGVSRIGCFPHVTKNEPSYRC